LKREIDCIFHNFKIHFGAKHKNTFWGKTQKHILGQNTKKHFGAKHKNTFWGKTQKHIWCKTQKHILGQNTKTHLVQNTKTHLGAKHKNTFWGKTQKHILGQNTKTHFRAKINFKAKERLKVNDGKKTLGLYKKCVMMSAMGNILSMEQL